MFGLDIQRSKAVDARRTNELAAAVVAGSVAGQRDGGWLGLIRESFTGAWQRNVELRLEDIVGAPIVFRCIHQIASDVAKLPLRLVELTDDGIWQEVSSPAFSPVLRKPNRYQTRIQFVQQWLISKLARGNTYVVKERDARGVVVGLYVLDPTLTTPLVAPDGSVYYRLQRDVLAGVEPDEELGGVVVPASEIIHDRYLALYHPLVGVSPIAAAAMAARQGIAIADNSTRFFADGARPWGVLTAPGAIGDDTARRLRERWQERYRHGGEGGVTVLGDGLKFEAMTMSATDAQALEQLRWSDERICSAFGIPPFKAGVGHMPSGISAEALNQIYYSDCLQIQLEEIEIALDEGLGIGVASALAGGRVLGTEFVVDNLLRMDSVAQADAAQKAVGSGIVSPNEARQRWYSLPGVEGGESPYLQQQNFSLQALARRDAQADPFNPAPAENPAPALPPPVAEPAPAAQRDAGLPDPVALSNVLVAMVGRSLDAQRNARAA